VLGVDADIVTFGKVIGGGLPVGAFAARAEIMGHLAPDGPVYQAGTLSGNPLAMSAGLAMLTELNNNPEVFRSLADKTKYLGKGLAQVLTDNKIPFQMNRFGSMISIHFTEEPVVDFESSAKGNNATFKKYFHGMLKQGIYLPPSAFESYFLNDALSYQDLDETILALSNIVKELQA
jgi:glutamate-1-semialdehyde 2,1-aminomutase